MNKYFTWINKGFMVYRKWTNRKREKKKRILHIRVVLCGRSKPLVNYNSVNFKIIIMVIHVHTTFPPDQTAYKKNGLIEQFLLQNVAEEGNSDLLQQNFPPLCGHNQAHNMICSWCVLFFFVVHSFVLSFALVIVLLSAWSLHVQFIRFISIIPVHWIRYKVLVRL